MVTMASRPTRSSESRAVPGRARSTARRELVRTFREHVSTGAYRPPVDELSAELARWLVHDGIAPAARR
jgi:hypothetical protein